MADSTQLLAIDRVLDFLCDIAKDVVQFPKDKEATAREFEMVAGFPGVIGCIDGTYIPMTCPNKKIRSTYTNRHDQVSLTMQAEYVIKEGRFVDVFTGTPGKIHDSRVLSLSTADEELPLVCEINKYHLLGDAAYAIREHLLTPFKDYGNMTRSQTLYNKSHSVTRVIIENAFGLLKQRFRQLRYVEFETVDKITKFIMSCCVLHNLCLDDGDTNVDDVLREAERQEDNALRDSVQPDVEEVGDAVPTTSEGALRRLGELKRDRIAALFLQGAQ
ncbi:hypothetical protein MTO96_034243 [Rhipicephalus appendiculatus]